MNELLYYAISFSLPLIIYLLIFPSAPPPSNATIHRALIPNQQQQPNTSTNIFYRAWRYLTLKPNPSVQILFVLLVGGSYVIFMVYVQHQLLPVDSIHHTIAPLGVTVCFVSFIVGCAVDAGRITPRTHAMYTRMFVVDEVMYFADNPCRTCTFTKPARSKHCAVCDVCVPKFDHHCVWLNRCVGLHNYRYFLLFLFTTASFLTYGSVVLISLALDIIDEHNLWHATFVDADGRDVPSSVMVVFRFLAHHYRPLVGLIIIASVCALAVTVFLLHHLYLALRNVTTNENSKRSYLATVTQKELDKHHGQGPITAEEVRALAWVNTYDLGLWGNIRQILLPAPSENDGKIN